MATLTVQNIAEDGLVATYDAAEAGGDTFPNASGERTFLHVKNGDASSHTVTVAALQNSYDIAGYGDLTKPDASVTVSASGEAFIGPFPTGTFGSNPDITYDDVTSVTIAAIRV